MWRLTTATRTGAVTLGAIGVAFALLTMAEVRSAPGVSFAGTSWVAAAAELTTGCALITVGLVESWWRPASRSGLLFIAAGIGLFFPEWNNSGLNAPAFTFGLIVSAISAPVIAHAALAYPTGRLASRLDLSVLLVAYFGAGLVLGLLPALFFDPAQVSCALCPANLVLAHSAPGLVNSLQRIGLALGLGWAAALASVGVHRLRKASAPLRRVMTPVVVPAIGYLLLVAADFAYSMPRGTLADGPVDYRLWLGETALLALTALGVASTWIRDRRTRSAVVRLVMDAAHSPPPGGLREVLAGLLGDTDLELTYLVGQPPRQVRADGQLTTTEPDNGRAATPLVRSGRTVAMLRHRAGLLDDPGTVREI